MFENRSVILDHPPCVGPIRDLHNVSIIKTQPRPVYQGGIKPIPAPAGLVCAVNSSDLMQAQLSCCSGYSTSSSSCSCPGSAPCYVPSMHESRKRLSRGGSAFLPLQMAGVRPRRNNFRKTGQGCQRTPSHPRAHRICQGKGCP